MNSACAWWVLARRIVSVLSINSTQTHWVNAPSPPVKPLPPIQPYLVSCYGRGPRALGGTYQRLFRPRRHTGRTRDHLETLVDVQDHKGTGTEMDIEEGTPVMEYLKS